MFVLGPQQEVGELEIFATCCCVKNSSCDFAAPEQKKTTRLKTNPERSHRLFCSAVVKRFTKTSTGGCSAGVVFNSECFSILSLEITEWKRKAELVREIWNVPLSPRVSSLAFLRQTPLMDVSSAQERLCSCIHQYFNSKQRLKVSRPPFEDL